MLKDLVLKNRSYRGYDESYRFTADELEELVDLARLCPSSVNIQPLKYYCAWEEEVVNRIRPLTRWGRGLPDMELPHPGMQPTAFIVICQDTEIHDNLSRFQKDVGIVAQTMLLGAAEKGLGGCMIGNFTAGEISSALGLSENLRPLLVVALGKPAEHIVLTEVGEDGNTKYYRDAEDNHYVPKRALKDILI